MKRPGSLKRFFRDNFLSGILVVVPIAASIYVLVMGSLWLYRKLVFLPINYEPVAEALRTVLPDYQVKWIIGSINFLEFLVVLVALVLITAMAGLVTKMKVGNWLLRLSERVLGSIPLIGVVYSSLKQLLQAVFSGKGNFSKVVMIEYPRKGVWSLGFVSREADSSFSRKAGKKLVSVFVPTTPNPTSGFLLMAPEDEIKELDLTVEQAFKTIISAGMVLAHEEVDEVIHAEGGLMEKVMEIQKRACAAEGEEKDGAK